MNEFANNLKLLRIEHGQTQTELAKVFNVAQRTIHAWENNLQEPSIDTIIKIAKFYNVSINYLYGLEEEDGRVIIQEPELPSDEKKILEEYRALSPELKSLSRDYFKSLNALNKNNTHNNDNK